MDFTIAKAAKARGIYHVTSVPVGQQQGVKAPKFAGDL
jgi:hypothetical protein